MATQLTTNTQSNASGVFNKAVGSVVSGASHTDAVTISLGFTPRAFRWVNLTDRITDEWYEGMAADSALHTVAAGTRTLATSGGITVAGGVVTIPAALAPASKTFAWEAEG